MEFHKVSFKKNNTPSIEGAYAYAYTTTSDKKEVKGLILQKKLENKKNSMKNLFAYSCILIAFFSSSLQEQWLKNGSILKYWDRVWPNYP